MHHHLRGYTAYSIGCGIVWAVILGVSTSRHADPRAVRLVFGGWVLGWVSATIARYVYPPPRRHEGR